MQLCSQYFVNLLCFSTEVGMGINSCTEMFCKKGVFEIFTKFTGKTPVPEPRTPLVAASEYDFLLK